MIIRLIRLILEMIREDKEKAIWRGYYVQNDYPKTYGTKIRKAKNDE